MVDILRALGMEFGPIMPPDEQGNMVIRVTRGCPWNRCGFCATYQGVEYGIRPFKEIYGDIIVAGAAERAHRKVHGEPFTRVFLQDGDVMAISSSRLTKVIANLKKRFPTINYVSLYATSMSIAKKSDQELHDLHETGLACVYRGIESGYDPLLKYINKGATKQMHIEEGQRVKQAGIELTDTVIPGLAGNLVFDRFPGWMKHAEHTADVVNSVNPDHLNLRALVLSPRAPLWKKYEHEGFRRLTDRDIAIETRLFVESLEGILSVVSSDHKINPFKFKGKMPEYKDAILQELDRWLSLGVREQYVLRWEELSPSVASLLPQDFDFSALPTREMEGLIQLVLSKMI